MFRSLIMVLVTGVALMVAMIFVIGIGMRRIAASQKAYDASWHPPVRAALIPATQPAPPVIATSDDESLPKITSIDLWAKEATLHGMAQLTEGPAARVDPAREKRHGSPRQYTARLSGFYRPGDSAEWVVEIPKKGDYEIDLTCGYTRGEGGHFAVSIGDQELAWTPETDATTRWGSYLRSVTVGKLTLPAGKTTFTFGTRPGGQRSNLTVSHVEIIPLEKQ